ncbi:MAG: tetratricopeptide repeat protein [Myxococcota bacterium]|nr:tetratricopeptide repeat protein [Myxococcota bacterium]
MKSWQQLLDRANIFFQQGRCHQALQYCDKAAFEAKDGRYEARLLRGRILLELGDVRGALSAFESIASIDILDARVDFHRGAALFELGRLAEADGALRSAVRCDDTLAEGYYLLGLISELLQTEEEEHFFREARRLEPETYSPSCHRRHEDFEDLIYAAVLRFPEPVQHALEQYSIVISELPLVDQRRKIYPEMSPRSLALVWGTPLTSGGVEGGEPCLMVFKRNVERALKTDDEIVAHLAGGVLREFVNSLDEIEINLDDYSLD